jgi:hypothetical protein
MTWCSCMGLYKLSLVLWLKRSPERDNKWRGIQKSYSRTHKNLHIWGPLLAEMARLSIVLIGINNKNLITWLCPLWPLFNNYVSKLVTCNVSFHIAATGYGMDDREARARVRVGSRIFSSPCRPDRLWGPPSLLVDIGYSFPGGKAAGVWSWPLTSA